MTNHPSNTGGDHNGDQAACSVARNARQTPPLIAALVAARKARRISQDNLAWRLGVRQPAISRWELGVNDVPLSRLIAWAAALGLSLELVSLPSPEGPLPELVAGGLA